MKTGITYLRGLTAAAFCSLLAIGAMAQTPPAQPAAAAAPQAAPAPAPRPSPMAMARVTLGDAYVRVVYSRPSIKGRANIFGTKDAQALVPYGEVWRTGANEATELTTTRDILVGGKKLPAGTYSVFTVPGTDKWQIHFNSGLGLWGNRGYDAANNVLSVEAKPAALTDEVETFTIELPGKDSAAELVLKWVKTEVRVPVALAG